MRRLWLALLFAFLPAVARADDGGVGDRVSIGGDVVIATGESVPGSLVVIGGNAEVRGEVRGDVVVIGGALTVQGHVGGQVVALGGPVTLSGGTRLDRDLAVMGGDLTRTDADVAGRVDYVALALQPGPGSLVLAPSPSDLQNGHLARLLAVRAVQIGLLLALLVALGLATTLFFPRRIEVMSLTLQDAFWPSALMGLLTLPVGLGLSLVFAATLVGAPLGLLVGFALATASALGLVALAQTLGERAWEAFFPRREPGVLATTGGLLVLLALALPLFAVSPLVGVFGLWLVALPGLGAVLLSRAGQGPPVVAESRP
jgi:hypothetical protein